MIRYNPTMGHRNLFRRKVLHVLAIGAASMALFASAAIAREARGADPPTPRGEEAKKTSAKGPCARYGPKARELGNSGICAFAGGVVMGYVFKEFTDVDIGMIGQRIPVPYLGAGLPMAYYFKKDVSPQTEKIDSGALAMANLM